MAVPRLSLALLCLAAPAQSFVVPGVRAPARPAALQPLRQPARASPLQLVEKKPAGGFSVPFFLDVRATPRTLCSLGAPPVFCLVVRNMTALDPHSLDRRSAPKAASSSTRFSA